MQTIRASARALIFVVAGALIVLGHALSIDMGRSGQRYVSHLIGNRAAHVAGGLLTAAAAALLSLGLFAAAKRFDRRFDRIATITAAVGAAGLAMGLAIVAMVMGALAGRDPHMAARAYDILNHATLASLPFLLAYLFTLGVLALAISLIVAGTRQERWIAALLLAGTAIDFVSPSGGALTAALHIPQALAFALLGVSLLGRAERPRHPGVAALPPIEPLPVV